MTDMADDCVALKKYADGRKPDCLLSGYSCIKQGCPDEPALNEAIANYNNDKQKSLSKIYDIVKRVWPDGNGKYSAPINPEKILVEKLSKEEHVSQENIELYPAYRNGYLNGNTSYSINKNGQEGSRALVKEDLLKQIKEMQREAIKQSHKIEFLDAIAAKLGIPVNDLEDRLRIEDRLGHGATSHISDVTNYVVEVYKNFRKDNPCAKADDSQKIWEMVNQNKDLVQKYGKNINRGFVEAIYAKEQGAADRQQEEKPGSMNDIPRFVKGLIDKNLVKEKFVNQCLVDLNSEDMDTRVKAYASLYTIAIRDPSLLNKSQRDSLLLKASGQPTVHGMTRQYSLKILEILDKEKKKKESGEV